MTVTTTPPHAALGAQIRSAREASGFSQEAFAPLVGITRRHLMRLERGKHMPSDALLRRIAEAIGQDPDSSFRPPRRRDGAEAA